ncbi:MAG: glycosyltransferase [Vicinamibacterales bacterium]
MLQNASLRTSRHEPIATARTRALAGLSGIARRRRAPAPPRVLFYSHDSFGLGHIRRTLSLCDAVRRRYDDASLLVLTGSSAVSSLPMPTGVDWVKLPCVTKSDDGEYRSRYLPIGFDAVRAVRREIIYSAAQAYRPSLMFVDNVPLGLKGELRRTLESVRRWNPDVRVVLTLRDILDDPRRTIDTWKREGTAESIERFYDDVVVYGSPDVFDFVREYELPQALAARCHYAGYIRREPQGNVPELKARLAPAGERLVLVTVGGGGDGHRLIHEYLAGLDGAGPAGIGTHVRSLVVCGPEMAAAERQQIRTRYAHRHDISIIDFTPDLVTTMAAADVVVGMGGYNTICEILSLAKPAVIMPRTRPRLEQWIRCSRLADLGLLRVVDPEGDAAAALVEAVRAALQAPPPETSRLDLSGLSTLDRLLPAFVEAPCR